MIFLPLLKQHVSHSQMAYLIVLFMPIKTTEAKYRCTVIFFLEWPLIHFLLLLFFLRTLSCCRLAVYVCSGGDVCRYRSHFKRGGRGGGGGGERGSTALLKYR